jgi:hypothetical protein
MSETCTWPHCAHTAKDQCKGTGVRSDAIATLTARVKELEAALNRLTPLASSSPSRRPPMTSEAQAALGENVTKLIDEWPNRSSESIASAAIDIVLEEAARVAEAFPAHNHGNLATAPPQAAEQAADEIAAAIRGMITPCETPSRKGESGNKPR